MVDILILHGWGSCAENWSKVKELLEKDGCKVYLPDLPGFGQSVSLSRAWSIDDYVEWVRDFCEKQNLPHVSILGHSFGGSIAIKFSAKHPEKVKKLILVDSAGIRRKTLKKEISKKIAGVFKIFSFLPLYSFFRKTVYAIFFRRSDYLSSQGIMQETYLKAINEDLLGSLSNIHIDTLIIWGEKDKLTSLKDAHLIKEKIFKASLEIIPNIGHNPHSEAPDVLVKKVLNFVNS